MFEKIYIYTDGSCINNPGPGGCASIVKVNSYKRKILKAGFYYTTNNRMELMAVIFSLKYLLKINKFFSSINIFTDSCYLYNGITNWIYMWKKKNWKNSNNKLIKNIDLWLILYNLSFFLKEKIKWNLIKAHSGHIYNEECDKIALLSAKKPTCIDLYYPFSICKNKI